MKHDTTALLNLLNTIEEQLNFIQDELSHSSAYGKSPFVLNWTESKSTVFFALTGEDLETFATAKRDLIKTLQGLLEAKRNKVLKEIKIAMKDVK